MKSDHKQKLGQSDLVYWFIGHLAYIAVLPAKRQRPWAACLIWSRTIDETVHPPAFQRTLNKLLHIEVLRRMGVYKKRQRRRTACVSRREGM